MTIEEALAMEEIKQLRSKYSHCYDANLLEELVDLFTDAAVCEWDEAHGGCWIGKEEIRKNYSLYFQKFGNKEWIVMHAVTNPWIVFPSPDTAEGRWFLLVLYPDRIITGGVPGRRIPCVTDIEESDKNECIL